MGLKAIPDDYVVIEDLKFKESKRQMDTVQRYSRLQISEQFFKLHYRSLNLIINIKNCFPLYFYMCDNVTRGKGRFAFWNEKIVPYYHEGYLPFAKHQEHIAKDLGVDQTTVSKHLKILLQYELIAKIGVEIYSDRRPMDVWSMGRWIEDNKGRKDEIYYLQAISFEDKTV